MSNWTSSNAGLVLSLDGTTPVAGRNSLVVTKGSSDLSGELVYTDFDSFDLSVNDLIQVSFDFKISDISHKNDWKLELLDSSASHTIFSRSIIPEFNSNGIAAVSFFATIDSDPSVRLQFVLDSTDTDTYNITIDNVYAGKPNYFTVTNVEMEVGTITQYASDSIDPETAL